MFLGLVNLPSGQEVIGRAETKSRLVSFLSCNLFFFNLRSITESNRVFPKFSKVQYQVIGSAPLDKSLRCRRCPFLLLSIRGGASGHGQVKIVVPESLLTPASRFHGSISARTKRNLIDTVRYSWLTLIEIVRCIYLSAALVFPDCIAVSTCIAIRWASIT